MEEKASVKPGERDEWVEIYGFSAADVDSIMRRNIRDMDDIGVNTLALMVEHHPERVIALLRTERPDLF